MLQQGTGLVDAKAAVYGTTNNCANQGLNIAADLNGTQHYMGSVTQNADGTFQVTTPNGALWSQGTAVGCRATCGIRLTCGRRAILWNEGYTLARGIPVDRARPVQLGHSVGRRISVDHRHGRQLDVADVREFLGRA